MKVMWLEQASLQTIESGTMTKDLAILADKGSIRTVDSAEFLSAVRARLESMIS